MKMWAVFDKDGKLVDMADSETIAMIRAATCRATQMHLLEAEGYTCQPVVVMREEVYKDFADYAKFHEGDIFVDMNDFGDLKASYVEFLKAGE